MSDRKRAKEILSQTQKVISGEAHKKKIKTRRYVKRLASKVSSGAGGWSSGSGPFKKAATSLLRKK